MEFGPVKEAIKRSLVFFAESPPKWFPPFMFGFQNKTEGWANYQIMSREKGRNG
jgi:hypothetical protein